MRHLTLRVAWHDRAWDGTVCTNPSENAFCLALDRIRLERDDDVRGRDRRARRSPISPAADLPPCRRSPARS